ncbi:PEP-utilizing enzyme [Mycobacteroides franklinii]|uniref:PEP-utilizing protein n=1 Tax=Mycobacteroides franklinii TaxID=948102 RepID=A0A4R5PCA9_9MYCO|nr:PEP-utilizing enzyme [Mycobacteroides franklinii]ORA63017.1 PEP-utilizing protein [Mycobacteroides franklinii]TDH22426.1 PEP-utilizing protein [Mycobacteroides franklinii]
MAALSQMDSAALAASPVHLPGRALRWTTANVDEGLPGIITPITWSMYFPPTESTMRDCWVDLGVLPESKRAIPEEIDGRFLSVVFGHAIGNVDLMGQMAAAVPGGRAAAMEEQLFGSVSGEVGEPKGLAKIRRYPQVLVKSPIAIRRALKRHALLAAETDIWWRRSVFDTELGPRESVAALVGARQHFERVLGVHMVLSMAAQAIFTQVEALAARAGHPGLGGEVIKSEEGTTEFGLVRDLWRLSDGTTTLDAFLRTHGYHGPREGLVDSVVWREKPSSLHELAEAYRSRRGSEGIDEVAIRRRHEQRIAQDRLESGLGRIGISLSRKIISFASRIPEWRETGRAGILKSVDVARHAHRVIGRDMAERGLLDDPADCRFLTIDELNLFSNGKLEPGTVPALVAQRRQHHQAYSSIHLPHVWRGVPPVEVPERDGGESPRDCREITGIGVSAGVAEGVVHVVLDLDEADCFDGNEPIVMVCRATDPSWASLFPLAVAVVTDVGSQMSHAAIVCRELGLPCIANTRTGTSMLRNGMRVRVDANTGVVTVLDR